jgi:hypothetical protein
MEIEPELHDLDVLSDIDGTTGFSRIIPDAAAGGTAT